MAPGMLVRQHKGPQVRVAAASLPSKKSPRRIRSSPTGSWTGSWAVVSDSAKQYLLHRDLPVHI